MIDSQIGDGTFHLNESIRLQTSLLEEAVRQVCSEREKMSGKEMFPLAGIMSGSSDVVDRHIDVISIGNGSTVIYLKLSLQKFDEVQLLAEKLGNITDGNYEYGNLLGEKIVVSKAKILELGDNMTIRLSSGEPLDHHPITGSSVVSLKKEIAIEINNSNDSEEITARAKEVLDKLNLSEIIVSPTEEDKKMFELAMFQQQHKLNPNLSEPILVKPEQLGAELEIQEVLPGYKTVVDVRASEIYQSTGPLYLIHRTHLNHYDDIVSVLKNGLLSSHERYKRGLGQKGDLHGDFFTGGADSVFLSGHDSENIQVQMPMGDYMGVFIFNSKLLNRCDWYAYTDEYQFGASEGAVFDNRLNPTQFFEVLRNEGKNNEIMFKKGVKMLENFVVSDDKIKNNLIIYLEDKGIADVNGKRLDEFIVTTSQFNSSVS